MSESKRVRALTIAAALAAGTALAAGAQAFAADRGTEHAAHGSASAQSAGSDSSRMHQSMMKDMKQMMSMKMTGDMDMDFAMMMHHHHESGIRMAEMELKNGKDAKMQQMARKVIDSQKKDNEEFDRWMKARKSAPK